jgi:hypothetical protein
VSGPSRGGRERARPDDAGRDTARRNPAPSLAAIYVGLASFSVLAGLACYFLLLQLGLPAALAAILGLAFALLTRIATASLAREWLLRAAERARERQRR